MRGKSFGMFGAFRAYYERARSKFKYLGTAYKVSRVVVLSAGIYQIGVLHGTIMHASDPQKVQTMMIQQTVSSVGGTDILDRFSKEHKLSTKVADEVLYGARLHIKLKLMEIFKLNEVLEAAEKMRGIGRGGASQADTTNVAGVDIPTFMISEPGNQGLLSHIASALTGMTKDNKAEHIAAISGPRLDTPQGFYIPSTMDFVTNEQYMDKVKQRSSLPSSVTSLELAELRTTLDGMGNFYSEAWRMLQGKWDVLVYDSKEPNAFVTPTVPRVIFVSTAMFSKYKLNQDELGLILAHEVSHLILQHTNWQTNKQLYLDVAYMVILALLPAELVLFAESLSFMNTWILASYSRDNENEADCMGMQVASRACFNIVKGAEALGKISAHENKDGERVATYADTHPLSTGRYNDMKALADRIERLDNTRNPLYDSGSRARCRRTQMLLGSFWR